MGFKCKIKYFLFSVTCPSLQRFTVQKKRKLLLTKMLTWTLKKIVIQFLLDNFFGYSINDQHKDMKIWWTYFTDFVHEIIEIARIERPCRYLGL